ncbi:hypothetical protein [Methylovorus sp. MP688]|uniref:hypothetical protein n=1 Tax=Methylovorus sp. (strain MP688) TaxID=887061 RepID=UPI0001EC44A3|nr:hypothetical protein [Methylovorus sp. MP688]ADQ83864.1 DnaK supressor [Methylovorus sp. MP688]
MGFFNTVLKSVAKKAALAALVVVGKQVLTKAIGSAIDKRKAEDTGVGEETQAPSAAAPSDATVKAKPVRRSRAKPKPAVTTDEKLVKKPAASRSKTKDASTSTATARKPRAPRKPKVVESKGEEPGTPNQPAQGPASE